MLPQDLSHIGYAAAWHRDMLLEILGARDHTGVLAVDMRIACFL